MVGRARPGLGSGCLLHRQVEEESEQVVKDDVLFGHRLQLFAEAQRRRSRKHAAYSVCTARLLHWKRQVDRHGSSGSSHPHPRRPPANQRPRQALHKTILDECWRPAFARYLYPRLCGLRRDSRPTSPTTTTTAHTTAASPAATSRTSSTLPAKWRPDEPHRSAHPGVRPP